MPSVAREPGTLTRYVEDPRALVGGHAVKLLRSGAETFPAWLAAIDAAKTRISLEMYIFSDDQIGRQFAEALGRAARRGVEVRVLYDYVGCRSTPASFFAGMRAQGVHTIAYHKYRFWRPRFWALIRRNHRKTLVCDGRIGFTGGLNISDEWVSKAHGGGDWRDAVIQVEGPEVASLEATFLQLWNRRARKWARLDPAQLPRLPAAGDVELTVISNKEMRDRFTIRRAALQADARQRDADLPREPVFRAGSGGAAGAPERGPARGRRAAPAAAPERLAPARLGGPRRVRAAAGGGVRIWRSRSVVHTKVVAVDDVFVSIGSYNFDHRSLAYNLETVVNVLDGRYAGEVVAMVNADMAESEELTREAYARRPLFRRLLERLAYSFRKWL